MCVCVLSHVWLFVIPWTVACQAPLYMGILQARILEWVVMPSPSEDLPIPGNEPTTLTLQVDSLLSEGWNGMIAVQNGQGNDGLKQPSLRWLLNAPENQCLYYPFLWHHLNCNLRHPHLQGEWNMSRACSSTRTSSDSLTPVCPWGGKEHLAPPHESVPEPQTTCFPFLPT